MCYNTAFLLQKKIRFAKEDPDVSDSEIRRMEEEYDRLQHEHSPTYYQNGFATGAKIPIKTQGQQAELANWGLLPSFVKPEDKEKYRRYTLLARSENLFTKNSWKQVIKKNRCIILIDGFFEYHHYKSKTYPFFIRPQAGILKIAGIWNHYVDHETGEVMRTVAMVTTKANNIMKFIHNNPKNPGRMPAILSNDKIVKWLTDLSDQSTEKVNEEYILELTKPNSKDDLIYHTVDKLIGKNGVGNSKEAIKRKDYERLTELDWINSDDELDVE